jgi:hypothetical protein
MALRLWEELGNKNMDVSTLSRVITGHRLFTFDQVQAFCQVLNLSDSDRHRLKYALTKDLAIRYGLDLEMFYPESPDFDYLRTLLELG